jgi:hypothetical protein
VSERPTTLAAFPTILRNGAMPILGAGTLSVITAGGLVALTVRTGLATVLSC